MWEQTWNMAAICGFAVLVTLSIALVLGSLTIIAGAILDYFRTWKDRSEWRRVQDSLRAEPYSLNRWLSYEWPVVEQVVEVDMSEFREKFRERYKRQEADQTSP